MNQRRKHKSAMVIATVSLVTIAVAATRCAFKEDKVSTTTAPSITSLVPAGSVATYTQLQTAIFTPKCLSCHGGSGGLNINVYSSISARVTPGDAANSYLYQRVTTVGTIMPQGSPALSTEEKQAIADWINAGAANN